MTTCETAVTVRRGGAWTVSSSAGLVCGDVVTVEPAWVVPCDLLVLSGCAVVDESGLTGESMPVRKSCLPHEHRVSFDEGAHARHMLFAGTTVLQLQGTVSAPVLPTPPRHRRVAATSPPRHRRISAKPPRDRRVAATGERAPPCATAMCNRHV